MTWFKSQSSQYVRQCGNNYGLYQTKTNRDVGSIKRLGRGAVSSGTFGY
jgi:hypothetical protein